MAMPKKYIPEVHDSWAWSLAIRGCTDADIAAAFHVSERTINRWKIETDANGNEIVESDGSKRLSRFGKILTEGKESSDAKVEKSLFERAIGYDSIEEEKIIEYDPDGNVKPVKVRTVKKRVAPDTMAIMYWLNNRKRKTGEWAQRQEQVIESSADFMNQLVNIADLINNPEGNRELPK